MKTGEFPFGKATKDDPYYKYHVKGDTIGYWKQTKFNHYKEDFRDLIN